MLGKDQIERLRVCLRGELIEPGTTEYDIARKVYNGMIDRRPAPDRPLRRCGRCDRGVNFARENNLLLAIRGGGHNAGRAGGLR